MIFTTFHNRRVAQIENDLIRVSVTVEGGHIAEIQEKSTGVNPLWIPPWQSVEPGTYTSDRFPEYGNDAESRLLAGIMGHNLCLDLFGPPSEEEAKAGLCVHGEAGVIPWVIEAAEGGLVARCVLPGAQIGFTRAIRLSGRQVLIAESVANLSVLDRPIAWTQHVTLGPPFLERGTTEFRRNDVTEIFTSADSSSGYTANLLSPEQEKAWFSATSYSLGAVFGYVWNRADFPWLGIWEENHSRAQPPWNGRTLTRGMEFGVSPFPETRQQMIERHRWLDTPCYRWLRAGSVICAEYYAYVDVLNPAQASEQRAAGSR